MLSSLDREKKDHYILTALARDNPGDVASNRRENSVQVRGPAWAQGRRQQAKSIENDCSRWATSLLGHGDMEEERSTARLPGCDFRKKRLSERDLSFPNTHEQPSTPSCDPGDTWLSS